MKIKFKNVAWDIDEGVELDEVGLKENFVVDVDIEDVEEDEIDDYLSDWLSDIYGYCHFGFDYEIIEE